jgi:hypothetical protein
MSKGPPPEQFDQLRLLRNENDYSRAILDDFASRTNNQRTTKIDQIISRLRDLEMPRWAPIRLFKGLAEQGYGRFIQGRKGHPSRFVWSSSSIEVGKAAKGDNVAITSLVEDENENNDPEEMITHQFYLRTNTLIKLDLPADLTEKEAERLGNFLKTLPV